MTYHSQNNEAAIIAKYFGGYVGTLLSIGECDGITFSNSYDLIEKGWAGVLVEPSEKNYNKIPPREGVEVHNFGIGSTGIVPFYITPDGLLCSTSLDNAKRWVLPYEQVNTQFYSFADALGKFGYKQFDFITIDAEGMDWIILQQIDLSNTRCLCIEYGDKTKEIINYCGKFGMNELHRNGENLILVK